MNLPNLILASASPRRAQLLSELEMDFQVVPSEAVEFHHEHLTPNEIAQLNAHRKARTVAKKYPDIVVLGADTLVCLELKVFGKPRHMAEAHEMLGQLQGKTHHVITGVCLIQLRNHHERLFSVSTTVRFKPLTSAQIHDYLTWINPLDKAGSYALQEHGDFVVAQVNGSRSNVIGLPLEKVKEELQNWLVPEPV